MSTNVIKILPSQIAGIAELHLLISQIDEAISTQYSTQAAKKMNVKFFEERINNQDSFASIISKSISKQGLEEIKRELIKISQTAPVIRITLSENPDLKMRIQLVEWFGRIHKYCLIEIMTDKTIIGGIKIRLNGHIYDESIRAILEKADLRKVLYD